MHRIFSAAALLSLSTLLVQAQEMTDPTALALANKILAKLSVEQKVSLCHGNGTMSINAIPEVGLPDEFWMDDGPSGVRCELDRRDFDAAKKRDDPSDEATALPRGSCLAATWNADLALQYGQVLGEECRARGKDMLLGPGVNIVRTPLCGRDHEYFGEDPCLSSQMAVGYINGVQSRDVAACVKHFALNNQELARNSVDVELDDRTLHEIYLPAFEAAVKQAHVLTAMGAYNCLRGAHCCESDFLLNQLLKHDWSFPGFVVSDWGGAHDTVKAALGGLDLEMNSGNSIRLFTTPLLQAVQGGQVPMSVLDDKVRRLLYVMAKIHKIDGQNRFVGSVNTPEHQAVARTVAEEGIVLLKNEKNLLPINLATTKSILVIGKNAKYKNVGGGGSSANKPPYEVSAWEGLQKKLGTQVRLDYLADAPPADLATKAKSYDLVLFFTGDVYGKGQGQEGEGTDRPNMLLPAGMDEEVAAVLAANPNAVVINQTGAPVEMPWVEQASTLVQYWFAGMEGGNALAAILTGDVNPSGRLPVTFPKQLSDSPAHALGNYSDKQITYAEGLLVGYRWFDAKKIAPLFPFGYGLSYTTFSLSDLKLSADSIKAGDPLTATVTVTNSGKRAGAEVVELYLADTSATVTMPPDELKGFNKVMLQPGESKTVSISLQPRDFSYWDMKSNGWKIDPGAFEVRVGTSSQDLPLVGKFVVD